MNRLIVITASDLERLKKLISKEKEFGTFKDSISLSTLDKELSRSSVVPSNEIPSNVITMNSTFVLKDLTSDESLTYSVVYPEDADVFDGKLSITSPIGTAVLGYAEGDTFKWQVPEGTVTYLVEKILYQPEASGNYKL